MSFPADELPVTVELLLDGAWVDITAAGDVLLRDVITINRGQGNYAPSLVAGSCSLTLKNDAGKYSPRNPLSEHYGKLGRNTRIRVRLPEAATAGGSGVNSTSLVAPTVDVADPALLACMWIAFDNSTPTDFNFTVPGSMTGGPEADDGNFGSSRTATQSVSAGATGTRTATASVSADQWMAFSVSVPGTVTVQERLSDAAFDANVVLTTGAGTQAGWSLLAIQGWDLASDQPPAPSGDGWILLGESDAGPGWIRAWLKEVGTAGAQAVTFSTSATGIPDNHAHLLVLSGVTPSTLPTSSARRFTGEVAYWPPRWDLSEQDTYVSIEAAGITRRLDRADALRSPIYRDVTSTTNQPLAVAYWPCEDGSGATVLASGLPGGTPMRIVGTASIGSVDTIPGSDPIVQLNAAALVGDIPAYTNTGTIAYRGVFDVPAAGFADGTLIADILCRPGGVARWALRYGTGGTLRLQGYDTAGTSVADSGIIGFDIRGLRQMIAFEVEQDGSNIDYAIFTRHIAEGGDVVEGGIDGTFNTLTVAGATRLIIGNRVQLTDCGVGHHMVGRSASLASTLEDAIVGYSGEAAADRMVRLCGEEGIDFTLHSNVQTAACGPQQSGTLLRLLQDAADVDRGILYEPRDEFGLAYRPLRSMYNQDTTLGLDYSAQEVAPPFEPVDDDQQVVNDVTVSRVDGSSYRAVQETGPLNVGDPADDPEAVGRYTAAVTVNAHLDAQLPSIAGWIRHKGTWDEARYTTIAVNLARLGLDGKASLIADALGVDIGDLASVASPPASVPPDTIEILAVGSTESLGEYSHSIAFNALPAGPYRVFVLDDPVLGRLETGGSTVASDFDAGTDTSMSVTVTGAALWHTGAGHVPFDIVTSGVRLTVTAVSGGSSPQTFTITQSPVNGVVKTIPAGSRIKTARLGALGL